jgi:gliding motility-associated-like protein
VPNAFSPNGDGVNDAFRVFGEDILSLDLRIYDRWGTLLFQTNDPSQGWDGRYKGEALNSGVFLWKAAIEGYRRNGKKFTEVLSGDVTLVK